MVMVLLFGEISSINVVVSDGTSAPSKLFWYVVGLFVIAAGVWLIWQINKLAQTMGKRGVFSTLGLLLILAGASGSYLLTRKPPIDWVYYTPELLETALETELAGLHVVAWSTKTDRLKRFVDFLECLFAKI